MKVPFLDLRAQHAPIKQEILGLWDEILGSAGFVGGLHVDGFEREFAAACDAQFCITVSDGTAALRLAMQALGAKAGDEIIVPANTFIATAEAVSHTGATPAFVDCDPKTRNLDPSKIEAAITPRTAGIVGVHLYGQTADFDAIHAIADKHHLWAMEDSAQGHLSTYKGRMTGSLARIAGFSFYPGKNLGATGEGGAVTTNDPELAKRVKMLRDHGSNVKYHHEIIGENARMSSVLAAALRVKLRHLPEWTEARRANAKRYGELLAGHAHIEVPFVPEFASPVWHLYVVHVPHRDAVKKRMEEAGIGVGLHYPVPNHLQPAYASLGYKQGDFPAAEYNASHGLSLPMFAELTDEQMGYVASKLRAAVDEAVAAGGAA